jgi:hypothetical protein
LELFLEAYVAALKALAPNYDADLLQASIDEARKKIKSAKERGEGMNNATHEEKGATQMDMSS